MKLSAIVAGMSILARHFKGEDGYHVGAEHDQIYVYATHTPLTPEEVAEMCALGWFQPECDFTGPSDYKPDESWSAFV